MIAKRIMNIANMFEPKRMPSNREILEIEGNYKLSSAIQKSGGYEYWAKKLNLEQKYSETKLGIDGERYIAKFLEKMGFRTELTSTKHPYDIYVDNCVKVDVKTANTSMVRDNEVHAYRLYKKTTYL